MSIPAEPFIHFPHLYPIIVSMLRKCLFIISIALLFASCNSAFRSSHTSVQLSTPVAEYLSQQNLLIHNNQPKLVTRQPKIYAHPYDSSYYLQYRKLTGTSVILEVSDTTGKMRNIAIPQTKLKAFPVALTTTVTPVIAVGFLANRNPHSRYNNWDALALVAIGVLNFSTDALTIPLVYLVNKHQPYAVPRSFSLSDLSTVETVDTFQKEKLYTITAPVNPHVTPYLNAEFQKTFPVFLNASAGYGLVERAFSQSSEPRLGESPWYSFELQIQPSNNFRWGMHHTRNQPTDFQCNTTTLQMAYVNHSLPRSTLSVGLGAGLGSFKRKSAPDLSDTSKLYFNRKLGADSIILIKREFIPNLQYFFPPIAGFIQYENQLTQAVSLTLDFRITRIESHIDYATTQNLKTREVIAPGITSERIQNIGFNQIESFKTKNTLYQFNMGLKIRLNN